MKFLFIVLFSYTFFQVSSQDLKVYKGSFETGIAEYQYFENANYERIYHGNFIYNGDLYTQKGKFNNGKRDGSWSYIAKNKEYSHELIWKFKKIINTEITGSYKNGLFDGVWRFKHSVKTHSSFDNKWEIETSINEMATFREGHFIGDLFYEGTKVGQFDENGFFMGEWKVIQGDKEEIIKYNKGIPFFWLVRDVKTGRKEFFADSTNFVENFWTNYDSISNTSKVYDKLYYIDTVTVNQFEYPEFFNRFYDNTPLNMYALGLWIVNGSHSYSPLSNPFNSYNYGFIHPVAYWYRIKGCNTFSNPCKTNK